jgi:hypothetical protein
MSQVAFSFYWISKYSMRLIGKHVTYGNEVG